MNRQLKQLTKTTLYHEDGVPMRLTAEYGFRPNVNRPHFTITAELKSRRSWLAGGCLHEEIAAHLPSIAPLIKWHLCDSDGVPMHYIANAIYHAEVALGISKWFTGGKAERAQGLVNFKSHVALGKVEGDQLPDCLLPYRYAGRDAVVQEVTAWCETRLPALQAAFLADMIAYGLITEE